MLSRQAKVVQHHPGYILFGGHYIKTLMMKGFPNSGHAMMLKSIFENEQLKKLNIHIRVTTKLEPTKIKWNTALKWKYRRLYYSVHETSAKLGEAPRIEEVKALQALDVIRDKATNDNMEDKHFFDVWVAITVSATALSQLKEATALIREILKPQEIKLNKHDYEQAECFQASGWLGSSGPSPGFLKTNYGRVLDKNGAGVFFPFSFGSNSDRTGMYNGHRVADGKMNLIDTTIGAGQHNFLVTGATGEGKSVYLKDSSSSFYDEGFRVFIFDVDGEYHKICEDKKGFWIDHTMQSGAYRDPSRITEAIGIPKHDAGRCKEAVDGVIRTASMLAGGLEPKELNAADRAVLQLFEQSGINIQDSKTWDRPHGGIHGWYQSLKRDSSKGAVNLQEKVWRYFEGTMRSMFENEDRDDRIANANYVVFNVGQGIDNELDAHTAMVKLNMSFSSVWAEIKKERARGEKWSAVICDELQRSLINPHFASFQNQVVTTIRKYNGVWMGGLNNPAVLWPEPTPYNQEQATAGSGIWENTGYKVLYWLEDSGIKTLEKKAGLPPQVTLVLGGLKGSFQYVFRKGIRSYDLLKKEIPPAEIQRGLYKTRGLRRD